ncbi:MAG: carbohydrate ABC transporter permease [Candidatus Omnitrophica bacterium]|nr:carbohydrate ABC transporter permease [Candidatus Omnitrophota bacterium]MCB9747224.1 carbohydrate ABC transporter permease [Candidatus Omnitrophota bacterium]
MAKAKIPINRYQVFQSTKYLFIHIFLMSVAATCIFPLFWMVRSALMTKETIFIDKSLFPSALQWGNFVKAWIGGNFGTYFLNSLFYTFSVVVGIVIISSLAAYAFSRLRFPGKDFFFYMFVAAMMIPLPGSFVPLVVLMNKIGLVNTRLGYILCMINVGLSMSILLLKTFFDKMPSDLEDAARIDGCGKIRIWWNVALPLARPAIAVVVIFNSLNVWNEFILANLLLTDDSLMTLQTGLFKFQGPNLADYPVLMAGLTIAAIPIIIIYLFMQKHIIKGLSSGAVVG